jgi:hypothetical protein
MMNLKELKKFDFSHQRHDLLRKEQGEGNGYCHKVFATAPRRWLKPSADIQSALKRTGIAF